MDSQLEVYRFVNIKMEDNEFEVIDLVVRVRADSDKEALRKVKAFRTSDAFDKFAKSYVGSWPDTEEKVNNGKKRHWTIYSI